jgi:hypothetical protein
MISVISQGAFGVLSVQLKLEALSLQEQKKHCQGLFRTPALMIQPPALVHVHDSS